MPTLYSGWKTGSVSGRFRIDWTRTYNAAHTVANFSGAVYIEFNYSTYDSVNDWAVSGDDGSHSGSNINYNGSGLFKIYAFYMSKAADANFSVSVGRIESIGGSHSASFVLDAGELAPYLTGDYAATAITSTGFKTSGLSATGNGSAINYSQVQWNTSPSDSGAHFTTAAGYTNVTVTGLQPNTLYYFRMRISNSGYGYGAMGSWHAFRTLATIPDAPTAWNISIISQIDAGITGNVVSDNGGATLTDWQVEYNLSASDTGALYNESGSPTLAPGIFGLTPGTVYYARLRAKNSVGWGAWTAWKTFTTLPGVYVRVDGVWKNAIPYVKVDGVWKQVVRYVKAGGEWRQ